MQLHELAEQAILCEQSGQLDAALAIYVHIANVQPQYPQIYLLQGSCRRRLKQEAQAESLFAKQAAMNAQLGMLSSSGAAASASALPLNLMLLENEKRLCAVQQNLSEPMKAATRALYKLWGSAPGLSREECYVAMVRALPLPR